MRHFLLRVLYTGLLLSVLILVYLVSFGLDEAQGIQTAADFARYFLRGFAVLQLCAVLLFGPAVSAGLIARERETRTLDYLLTTHLTSTQIVLQKWLASLVQLGAAVLAGLPVLALATLLGGISSGELFNVTAITLATLAFVTSFSLAVSACARRSRDAVVMAYAALFCLILGGPLAGSLLRGTAAAGPVQGMTETLAGAHPLSVIGIVLDGSQPEAEHWNALVQMAGIHVACSLGLLVLAIWALRRIVIGRESRRAWTPRTRFWWRPDLQDRPLLWRELFANRSPSGLARAGRIGLASITTLAMLGTAWQFADSAIGGSWPTFLAFALWLAVVLQGLGLLLVAASAANSVATEREKETWTTLVSTPLEAREIVLAKLAGSLYAARFLWPPLALVSVLVGVAQPIYIPAIACTLIGLIAASLAIGMLGVFFSFQCVNATRALGTTLGCLFGATTLGSCCIFPLGIVNPLYLLIFPGIATVVWRESPPDASWPLLIAMLVYGGVWLAGLAVHLGGAWGLWAVCLARFDHYAGRIQERAQYNTPSRQPEVRLPDQ